MARKPKPLQVLIAGTLVECQVVERLGFNQDVGGRAAVVLHEGLEQTAVQSGGIWRLWTARDRVRPLVEHIEREVSAGRPPFPPSRS